MRIDKAAAIVTGGGSGLGEATARALAASGRQGRDLRRRRRAAPRRSRPRSAASRSSATSPSGRQRRGGGRQAARGSWARRASWSTAPASASRGRPSARTAPHPLEHVPPGDPGQPDRHLQHDPARRRPRWPGSSRSPTASAASSSTPRRSPPSTARSARPPTRPPRAASSA